LEKEKRYLSKLGSASLKREIRHDFLSGKDKNLDQNKNVFLFLLQKSGKLVREICDFFDL